MVLLLSSRQLIGGRLHVCDTDVRKLHSASKVCIVPAQHNSPAKHVAATVQERAAAVTASSLACRFMKSTWFDKCIMGGVSPRVNVSGVLDAVPRSPRSTES